MKHITLNSKPGLPTLEAITVPARSTHDLVINDTRQTTPVAELNIADGGLVARIFPKGKNISWKVMTAASGAMSLRKWLSGISLATLIGALAISGCSSKDSGEHPGGQGKPTPQEQGSAAAKPVHKQVGEASWYGPGFQGQETANGETFNQKEMTAAHPTLPMGTKAKVTNLENGKKVEVRINDRGPFTGNRAIDLSSAAANKLDMKKDGTTDVKIETAKPTKKKGSARKSSKKKQGAKRAAPTN